ncbi:hypothetical protein GCM10027046_13400 [Uliginosibacterium flavum]|uniref:Uncharacterized protein n=1 Tax=Uliginosibacterium flavum TaxID=1396831 RepID=A0ABV2TQ18_9RHOO
MRSNVYGKFYAAGKDYESNLLIVDFVFSERSWKSSAYSEDLAAIQHLRSALGLSQDASLRVVHGDF